MSESKKPKVSIKKIVFLITDYWHILLSFIAGIISISLSIASLAIVLVYVIYQAVEEEEEFRSIRDLVLFLTCFLLGYLTGKTFLPLLVECF